MSFLLSVLRTLAAGAALLLAVSAAAGAERKPGPIKPPKGAAATAEASAVGVPVTYDLPATGALPQTYRVTLAIVDAQNPRWLISQFASGVVRTVTAENQGHFTETWDGLDDNFMPVPAGTYAVKGIYMPASKWMVDNEYHSVTPRFVGGVSAWLPTPAQWQVPEPFGGDPVGSPLTDVDVAPNGVAVFYYRYLENGLNNPMIDLKKPLGLGQFIRAFGSGGAAGGGHTCTDGETVWSDSTDGGPKYVYRADGKPFGTDTANRPHVYRPEGWVTAMAAWHNQATGESFVYVAQHGKIMETKEYPHFAESKTEMVDVVTVQAGATGKIVGRIPTPNPRGAVVRNGVLYLLQAAANGGWAIKVAPLETNGMPAERAEVVVVPASITPADLEVDSRGRLYLSDPAANHVYQLDRTGKITRTFGKADAQTPGKYDPLTFMAPHKLACWTDPDGHDRLLVVEDAGPNRVSEWNDDDGTLIREFPSLQTKANDGYAVDPEDPAHVYLAGHQGWLTRFKVDYTTGAWTVDAVYPHVGDDPHAPGFDHPQFIRANGHQYLACARSYNVYVLDGGRWRLSAAIIRERVKNQQQCYLWHDANGDGVVQPEEYRDTPITLPGNLLRYHGEQWLDDLSLVALNQNGRDVWRLAPASFDAHANPVFAPFTKLLTDPVFTARAAGTADAVHGGNELSDTYNSDWAMAAGSVAEGFYVQARGGPSFSANQGGQVKLSRYVPDGQGGYTLQWRTGRAAVQGVAQPGELYAAIHLHTPINGLVSVIDQSRCGIALYTEEGLYVDTLFPDGRRYSREVAGVYPQPGEFFAGMLYPNRDDGRIYLGMGKYTPHLFTVDGWSLKASPVHALTTVQPQVSIAAAQIASPPEIAVAMRGGAGAARVARFAPALGGAVLDGSLAGWESCDPLRFQADAEQRVEVRALYDADHLYLRWQVRLASPLVPKALQPVERIFTHDRLADTVGFYLQGDPQASGKAVPGGRPGDVRVVCGLFQDGAAVRPVALGLYPAWNGAGPANPITYRTPGGHVDFAHVGEIAGAELHHVLDADGKGFVLTAKLPRAAFPGLPPLSSNVRTQVDFDANLGGHNKFWWANSDGSASRESYDEPTEARLYPGAWAPAQFLGVEQGVVLRHWLICGPFGGPGAEAFTHDLRGHLPGTQKDYKDAARALCDAATYPPDNGQVDLQAVYKGELVRGYWHDPGAVRWHAAEIADLDTRVILGPSAQVWYGATWIHAPAATEVEFRFQSHPQTNLHWRLNGEEVLKGEQKGGDGTIVTSKTLTLQAGWNQVSFRGYCVGYPPFRAGLVLGGDPEKLWTLRLSSVPPPPDKK